MKFYYYAPYTTMAAGPHSDLFISEPFALYFTSPIPEFNHKLITSVYEYLDANLAEVEVGRMIDWEKQGTGWFKRDKAVYNPVMGKQHPIVSAVYPAALIDSPDWVDIA